jgi:hypothetical protein
MRRRPISRCEQIAEEFERIEPELRSRLARQVEIVRELRRL